MTQPNGSVEHRAAADNSRVFRQTESQTNEWKLTFLTLGSMLVLRRLRLVEATAHSTQRVHDF